MAKAPSNPCNVRGRISVGTPKWVIQWEVIRRLASEGTAGILESWVSKCSPICVMTNPAAGQGRLLPVVIILKRRVPLSSAQISSMIIPNSCIIRRKFYASPAGWAGSAER